MINISGGGSSTSVECNGYVSDSNTSNWTWRFAILAFNVDIDGSGTDEISFVCFVPISVGAIIDITDNAYRNVIQTRTVGGYLRAGFALKE